MAKTIKESENLDFDLRKFVLDSETQINKLLYVLKKREPDGSVRIDLVCKTLDIRINELSRLFMLSNINIKDLRSSRLIKVRRFKKLKKIVREIQHEETQKKSMINKFRN